MKSWIKRLRNIAWKRLAALPLVLILVQPLSAVENPSPVPKSGIASSLSRSERGFKNLLALKLDTAIADFTGPLVRVTRQPLSKDANRQKAARYLVLIGMAFQFDENELAACQTYRLAHNLDPDNGHALCGLIAMLGRVGRHAECDTMIGELADRIGKDPAATAAAALRARQRYNFAEATDLFERSVKLDSQNARTQFLLARAQSVQGLSEESAKHFQLAAKLSASPYMSEMCLGYADELSGLKDPAKQHYVRAGNILPDDPLWRTKAAYYFADKPQVWFDYFYKGIQCRRLDSRVFSHVALYLAYDHRASEALRYLEHPKRLRPWSSDLHLVTGKVYRAMKDREKAAAEFRRALELNPYLAPAYRDLSEIHQGLHEDQKALAVALKGVSTCPGYWPGWHDLAVLYGKQKNWSKAMESYQTAIGLVPSDSTRLNEAVKSETAKAHAGLGTCYYKLDRPADALAEAKLFNQLKMIQTRPAHLSWVILRPNRLDFRQSKPPTKAQQAVVHVALADILMESSELDDSCKEYRKAIALDPDNTAWHMCYFSVLIDKKDWAEAIRQDLVLTNQLLSKAPQMLHDWNRWLEDLQDKAGARPTTLKAPPGLGGR